MTASLAAGLSLGFILLIVRRVREAPLWRTLSASIDCWADGVQGRDR